MQERFYLIDGTVNRFLSMDSLLEAAKQKIASAEKTCGRYSLTIKLRTIEDPEKNEEKTCLFVYDDERGAV